MLEIDGGGYCGERRRLGRRVDLDRSVDQLKHALGCSHGPLKDVVLLAQILDGAEESKAVLEKRHQDTEAQCAAATAESSISQQQRQRQHSQELHHRIKPAVSGDGVLKSLHVIAINTVEFGAAAFL